MLFPKHGGIVGQVLVHHLIIGEEEEIGLCTFNSLCIIPNVIVGKLQIIIVRREEVFKGLLSTWVGSQLRDTVLLAAEDLDVMICDGLEEVSVVLQVVVAVIVIGSFAEGPALLLRHKVLLQRRLEVGHGFLRLLL